MGLSVRMSIFQENDPKFDSIDALNSDLSQNTFIDQLGESPDGFFKQGPTGLFFAQFDEGSFLGYDDTDAEVYGCFGHDVLKIISQHLVSGKIVFFIDVEGNPNHYYVVTPNSVVDTKPTF